MLSQKNLLSNTISGMRYYDYPLGAVYYNVLPYSHLFGLVADMLGPLYSGGTICFSENKLNFFRDIQIFKPTHLNLPPAMVYTMERMLNGINTHASFTGGKLQKIMCAGAAIDEEICKRVKKRGISIFPAYGLTECSPCVSLNCDKFMKEGSVGKVLPCCKVKIIEGEVVVKGDNVMLGYWNDAVETNRIMHDGWLYTGDLGYIDDEGFLYLTGRKSNIIVFEDGTKLMPELLESKILSISGVSECLVKKEILMERIRISVMVVLNDIEDENVIDKMIRSCTKEIGVLNRLYKIYILDEELPKNKLGKIIRS